MSANVSVVHLTYPRHDALAGFRTLCGLMVSDRVQYLGDGDHLGPYERLCERCSPPARPTEEEK